MYRILLVAIAVMAIGGIAVNCYVGNYYRADSIAEAAIDSDREVSVTIEKKDKRIQATQYDLKLKNYTITFAPQDKEKATKALIFYPGGRVQYTAYAPLMHELAKNNFVCILVHMPGNLAVLDQEPWLQNMCQSMLMSLTDYIFLQHILPLTCRIQI